MELLTKRMVALEDNMVKLATRIETIEEKVTNLMPIKYNSDTVHYPEDMGNNIDLFEKMKTRKDLLEKIKECKINTSIDFEQPIVE
jgi:hypothetical protein